MALEDRLNSAIYSYWFQKGRIFHTWTRICTSCTEMYPLLSISNLDRLKNCHVSQMLSMSQPSYMLKASLSLSSSVPCTKRPRPHKNSARIMCHWPLAKVQMTCATALSIHTPEIDRSILINIVCMKEFRNNVLRITSRIEFFVDPKKAMHTASASLVSKPLTSSDQPQSIDHSDTSLQSFYGIHGFPDQ